MTTTKRVRAVILGGAGGGIITPDLCQICKQSGTGIVVVRGLNGRLFSAHAWPCAAHEHLTIVPVNAETAGDDLRTVQNPSERAA